MREKKIWSDEEKREAIKMIFRLGNIAEAARRLNIPKRTMYCWFENDCQGTDLRKIRDQLNEKVIQEGLEFVQRRIREIDDRITREESIQDEEKRLSLWAKAAIIEKCAKSIKAVTSIVQRHEVSGPDGGPIETKTEVVIAWPGDKS